MSRKPPIKNYENKMVWMLDNQKYKCSGCGTDISKWYINNGKFYSYLGGYTVKLDFAHNFPRTDKNMENYPLMIDSIENGSVQHNHCNVARRPPWWKTGVKVAEKPFTYHQAEEIENRMKDEIINNFA